MKRMVLAVVVALVFLMNGLNVFAVDYPKSQGVVSDYVSLLSQDQKDQIKSDLVEFENNTTIEVAVVIVDSLQGETIEDYTTALANSWGVGKEGKDNGIVFLIATNDHKVRVALGGGLQNTINDQLAQMVIDDVVIPHFKNGEMNKGVVLGVQSIIESFGKPQTASTTARATNTTKSDNEFALIVLFGFLGLIVLGVLIWLLVKLISWFVWAKRFKKETIIKLGQVKDVFREIKTDLPKAKMALADLEKNYDKAIWSDYKTRLDNVDVGEIENAILVAEIGSKKSIFFRGEARELVCSLEIKTKRANKIVGEVNNLKQRILAAQTTINKTLMTIQEIIKETEALVLREDVSEKSKELFAKAKSDFLEIKNNFESLESIKTDWLLYKELFTKFFNLINSAKKKSQEDIETAKKARIEGPKLLEKLPKLIKEMERKNLRSDKAKQLIRQARDKYDQAKSMSTISNGSNINWLLIYFLLLESNDFCHDTKVEHDHYESRMSESFNSSNSSSSWSNDSTPFGGGGGFDSGGGASGSW